MIAPQRLFGHFLDAPSAIFSLSPTSWIFSCVQRQLLLPVATIRIAGLSDARREDAVGIEHRRAEPGALPRRRQGRRGDAGHSAHLRLGGDSSFRSITCDVR
jgi:hypothetical protein